MFNSQVLEVAVGLVFVYLVLSVASSEIKEGIAWAFGLRSKMLEEGIRNMLSDPNNVLTSRIFAHPLIAGTAQPGNRPSYISSRNFALALFDNLAPPGGAQPTSLEGLRSVINGLPDSLMRKTMLNLVNSGQDDLQAARQRVENWFDDSMERVGGWYKRKAQLIVAVTGLILCASFNADTLMVVKELWGDQTLRAAVTANAEDRIKKPTVSDDDRRALLYSIAEDIRTASAPPIGWKCSDGKLAEVRGCPVGWIQWLKNVLGILITAIAVAMGAPFWFDALNKIMNLRLSGSPPPDSRQTSAG